jgi:hypothetical protein
MTHRLLVNPDTPQAWEIPLAPGTTRIGRYEDNDQQVDHPSVSGVHCEIVVDDAGVLVRDLGSTNGTYVNQVPVREARLLPGQHLQLGSVDLRLEAAGGAVETSPTAPAAIRIVAPGAVARGPARVAPEEPPLPPPLAAPAALPNAGEFFCKSHPKTAARFFCPKCGKYFCELCVTTRATASGQGKFCRTCAVALTPLPVRRPPPVKERGFYARLPGAFLYPFKGFGVMILLLATLVFGGVDFLVNWGWLMGPFGWLVRVVMYGVLFLFLQNIIYNTTADEDEPLGMPELNELFGAAFRFGATVLISFALAIGLLVAKACDVDVPMAAIVAAAGLGCLYFPMAFLAVAMKDTALAANPLIVIPAILRIPLDYLVVAALFIAIFGLRLLGDLVSGMAGDTALGTRDMATLWFSLVVQVAWAFFRFYLLTVNVRILGLLYNARKEQLGWFSH